jgi:hypothetical protein
VAAATSVTTLEPIAPPSTELPPNTEPPSRTPKPSRLAEEIGWLDGARHELAAGQPPSALALLDRYDREFPAGALKPESIVLRVEALVAAKDRATAVAVAERSLPSLPEKYADKIRRLLSQERTAR